MKVVKRKLALHQTTLCAQVTDNIGAGDISIGRPGIRQEQKQVCALQRFRTDVAAQGILALA